jgi:peptide chain release factor 1
MPGFSLDQKLEELQDRFDALSSELSKPEVIQDRNQYTRYAKEHAELSKIMDLFHRKKSLDIQLAENKELLHDPDEDVRELAHEEIKTLQEELKEVLHDIQVALLPKDPNDDKNIVMEIRAGTGGEEAALFASELFRMYSRFAEKNNWKIDMLSQNVTGIGGFKEVIFLIEGKGAYSQLKYESGVHRVQRVPETESQGRIHTSAVTVAVLPEAEEV